MGVVRIEYESKLLELLSEAVKKCEKSVKRMKKADDEGICFCRAPLLLLLLWIFNFWEIQRSREYNKGQLIECRIMSELEKEQMVATQKFRFCQIYGKN